MSNYSKLKTNLKLAIQRLKLLEKKKTELSLKSRKEIADYISANKPDRARIRVEHIVREDNYVEAMEMLEMFCDLILARFGLVEKMKELDPGLDEAISTLIWATPRVSSDIQEFKIIADAFSNKYGKKYADACKVDAINNVNEKVKKRLGLEAPSKLLVEQYLVEIAKNFNVAYTPDDSVMLASGHVSDELIHLREQVDEMNKKYGNGGPGSGGPGNDGPGSGGGGGGGATAAVPYPNVPVGYPTVPVSYPHEIKAKPPIGFNEHDHNMPPAHPTFEPVGKPMPPDSENIANAPPLPNKHLNHPAPYDFDDNEFNFNDSPPPSYKPAPNQSQQSFSPISVNPKRNVPNLDDDLGLPSVPDSHPNSSDKQSDQHDGSASVDFDDLAKRFQNLKSTNFK